MEMMASQREMKEIQQYIEIENKLASAESKRQEKLAEVATKSSSKKHPRGSPKASPSTIEIEARVNAAAARREMFLLNKIDKATASSSSSKKLSPRCDLFSKVTPRLSDDGSRTTSPRVIKAARLDTFSESANNKDNDVLNQHFTMMPIIATGVIAIALIGVVSFWKH
jgi:hypothetical protein